MRAAALLLVLALGPPEQPEQPPVQRPKGLQPSPPPAEAPPAEAPPAEEPAPTEPDDQPDDEGTPPDDPREEPPAQAEETPAEQPTPPPDTKPPPAPPDDAAAGTPTAPLEPAPDAAPETPLEQPAEPAAPATEQPSAAKDEPPPDALERERERERDLNDAARLQWRREHVGARRLAYTALFAPLVYIPGPPVVAGMVNLFGGGQFAPKFRKGAVHRTRALGYWGQIGGGVGPGVVIHRHALALAGTGGPGRAMFYQVGGGLVHYVCCGENSWGGTVGAIGAWRRQLAHRPQALILGIPILIDMQFDSDVRGSIGVAVGLTNL